jgi:hypothetical protein
MEEAMSNRKSKTNSLMISVSKSAKQVLDTLTEELTTIGAATKLDNAPGVFMALHVECIDQVSEGKLYSVTHYYEQNDDLMRDPDVVFLKDSEANYYPVSYQQDGLGIYQEAVIFEADTIKGVRSKTQRDIASFCTMWMNNIYDQQLRDQTG